MCYAFLHLLQVLGVIPEGTIPYTDMMYGMIGATIFSAYLAYHTRSIVGKGTTTAHVLDESDYVYGASKSLVS